MLFVTDCAVVLPALIRSIKSNRGRSFYTFRDDGIVFLCDSIYYCNCNKRVEHKYLLQLSKLYQQVQSDSLEMEIKEF